VTRTWTEEERREWDEAMNGREREPASSWEPLDLQPIIAGVRAGEIVGPVPRIMARTDGACLLYPGEIHSLAGEPESCKGWITLGAVAQLIPMEAVLYVDFEDTPASIIKRLLALGAVPSSIAENFAYVRPSDPLRPGALDALLAREYALAVVDGVSEAYSLLGLDVASTPDAVAFLAALARPIAERGAAVLELDHVAKARETRGRFALGAQHKLAGIAVAYSVEVLKPPSRADAGRVKVKVEKDRHGHVRSHAHGGVIAIAHITPEDDGERVQVTLEPPDVPSESGFRPTGYMQRVSKVIEARSGLSKRAVREAVQGKAATIDLALELLVSELYVEARRDGQAVRHYSLRPFREADDD
jgi:hypothetical protein